MRPRRLRLGAIAAWLGVIALGFNALVPIHLAFDLAEALEPGAGHHAAQLCGDGFERCVLALLTGRHDDAADKTESHSRHHHAECAVCGSLGTLAGFAPAAAAALPLPARVEVPTPLAAARSEPHAALPAAYRSRAPPIASADLTT
jgi:hypothetical protein